MPGTMTSAQRWVRWWPAAVLSATYVALLAVTWGKWPDALVDYGHEVYAAWQLGEGRAFGQDVRLVATGPLSPYVNALLFWVFGAGLRVLIAFNLLVLACLTWLLHALLRPLADRSTATIACTAFLGIFGFGQYFEIGNYNYVTPYSHGATHGLALALLSIWFLDRWGARRERWLLPAAGLSVGLVFLTKPEMFAAASAAIAAWLCAFAWTSRDASSMRTLRALICSALLPPAAVMLMLRLRMPTQEAWHATTLPWHLLASPFARTPFYLAGMGLDAPWHNVAALTLWAAAAVCLVFLGVVAEIAARRFRIPARAAGLALFSVVLLVLGPLVPTARWLEAGRPLPAFVLAGAAVYVGHVVVSPKMVAKTRPASLGLALSVFSLALLGKMLLNARLVHYGFVLAVPGFMLAVVWLWWSAPEYLKSRGLEGTVFRGVAGAVIAFLVAIHLGMALSVYRAKRVSVGDGRDAFVSDARGQLVSDAVRLVQAAGGPGETLTVLPEGAMINFLTRRITTSPYLSYTPEMIAGFGEEAMLVPLRRAPPDLVLLVSRDASEYGARTFGRDYGLGVLGWIRENYAPVACAGGSPIAPGELGLLLLRRKHESAGDHDARSASAAKVPSPAPPATQGEYLSEPCAETDRPPSRGVGDPSATPPAPRTTAPSPPARGGGAPRPPSPRAGG